MGYGYTAILVALLARGRAWATLITAPLLGWVLAAGDVMKVSLQLPFQLTDVFTGFTLLLLVAAEPLLTHRPVLVRPQSQSAAAHPATAPSTEESRGSA